MNKTRRQKLEMAGDMLDSAKTMVEEVMEEEKDALGNIPENLENSDRAEAMEEAISNLDSAIQSIEEAEEAIDEAKTW